jgi:hypothetical protein
MIPAIIAGLWISKQLNRWIDQENKLKFKIALDRKYFAEQFDPDMDALWDPGPIQNTVISTLTNKSVNLGSSGKIKPSRWKTLDLLQQETSGLDPELIVVSVGGKEWNLSPVTDLELWREIYAQANLINDFNNLPLDNDDLLGWATGYNQLMRTYWVMLGVPRDDAEYFEANGISPLAYDFQNNFEVRVK